MNISIRELALQIATLARRVDALARTRPQLAHSSIEDGSVEEYDAQGNLVARIGTQPDGSHGVVVLDGPEPLRTTPPIAEGTALAISVTWDGNFIDPDTGTVDAELPAYEDFKYVEVHVGDVVSFVPSKETLSGYINSREGGTVGVPSTAGEKFVKFVTRSIANKTSVPSVGTPVTVSTLVDTEQFDLALLDIEQAQQNLADAQDMLNAAFPGGAFNVDDRLAQTVTGYSVEYAVGASETVAPGSGWSTATPTRTPGTYVWFRTVITYGDNSTTTTSPALLTGNDGAPGEDGAQGVPGPPGDDGQSLYTWVKYADTPTSGMSDSPAGKTYIGLAYNKTTATESTTYSDYQWALIKGEDGEQGIPGPPGDDGATLYTWVKYADTPTTGMSDDPTGKTYMGLAYNKTTATESTTYSDYQWSLIKGSPGTPGVSVTAITPYYKQQPATDPAPAKPTTATPSGWTTTEPTFAANSALYRTEKVTYSDATFTYTDVTKVASYEGIDAAMAAANGKNLITYTDIAAGAAIPAAPGVAGRREGDIHRVRRSNTGVIEREWILNSNNNWVVVYFGDAILTSLDVGKLTAGTAVVDQAVINKMAVQMATIIEADIGNLTAINATMDSLVAQSIAAQTGEFISIMADQILGGQIDALIGVSSAGKILAGSATGAAAELSSTGLNVYITNDAGTDRRPVPMISLGTLDQNALAITDGNTPTAQASISADGSVSGEYLSIGNDPSFGGQLLIGAFANRETDLTGDTNSLLWHLPWGMVGEVMDIYSLAGTLTATSGTTQMLAWNTWKLWAGREYRVTLHHAPLGFSSGGTGFKYGIVQIHTNWSTNLLSPPAAPTTANSNVVAYQRHETPGNINSLTDAQTSFVIRPGSDVLQNFAVSITGQNTSVTPTNSNIVGQNPWLFTVEDVGPARDHNGGRAYGASSPPVQKYTYYYYPTSVYSYQGTNGGWSFVWNGVQQSGVKMLQGKGGSLPGPMHTFARFGSAQSIAGSHETGRTIGYVTTGATKVEARLRLTGAIMERSSVAAKVGWTNTESGIPSPPMTASAVGPGGTTTLTFNSTGSAYVKDNASQLRIYVGPGTGASNADFAAFYGTDGSTSQRLRLQVDVWK